MESYLCSTDCRLLLLELELLAPRLGATNCRKRTTTTAAWKAAAAEKTASHWGAGDQEGGLPKCRKQAAETTAKRTRDTNTSK